MISMHMSSASALCRTCIEVPAVTVCPVCIFAMPKSHSRGLPRRIRMLDVLMSRCRTPWPCM